MLHSAHNKRTLKVLNKTKMKQAIIIVVLYTIGALELTGVLTQQQLHHGTITPKLTMVAMVDGKAFFLDRSAYRNRTQALTYCESLGMQLAEITSENQFSALDQAVVEEWVNGSGSWTGGIESKEILRYAWNKSNVGVDPSYLPYQQNVSEDSKYFLVFIKYVNNSTLKNSLANYTGWSGTLCETFSNDEQI